MCGIFCRTFIELLFLASGTEKREAMGTEPVTVRRPSARALEAISEGLEEIDAYFGFSGFSGTKGEQETQKPLEESSSLESDSVEEDEGDDDYGDDESGSDYFDREEIEVAIDAFLSALLNAKIIRKSKSGKLPSFADVFGKFFGQDHEISEKARTFEEHIKGYFGWVSPEDMRAAREVFSEIQEIVQREAIGVSDAK